MWHAVRVAAAATIIVAVVSVALGIALDLLVSHRLTSQVSEEVSTRLDQSLLKSPFAGDASSDSGIPGGHYGLGIYGASIFVWQVGRSGALLRATGGAPALPARTWPSRRTESTVEIAAVPWLVVSVPHSGGWLVAGAGLAELTHVRSVLAGSEALALPLLVVVVFLGSVAIGIRSVVPVEEARRRQLEFTADASHELRTPLSVIEAELALAGRGSSDSATSTRESVALSHIDRESIRLRRIVDDLLWLARFDAEPPPPGNEPIDLGTIAMACGERFAAPAVSRGVALRVETPPVDAVSILAPPEWIDRLAGVLVDNACRYAGPGGDVLVSVSAAGGRAVLAVEDSGPGIPPEARELLFDRFRRATDEPGGHGLGLAIADSVARSTGARWRIGSSPAGGARMEVSWPLA